MIGSTATYSQNFAKRPFSAYSNSMRSLSIQTLPSFIQGEEERLSEELRPSTRERPRHRSCIQIVGHRFQHFAALAHASTRSTFPFERRPYRTAVMGGTPVFGVSVLHRKRVFLAKSAMISAHAREVACWHEVQSLQITRPQQRRAIKWLKPQVALSREACRMSFLSTRVNSADHDRHKL